jgi:tetratricopeptide (TPR) repeat protein
VLSLRVPLAVMALLLPRIVRANIDAGVAPAPAALPADAAVSPAAAPGSEGRASDVEAAEHVAQGRRLYLLGRYQDAIAEYRRAYELRADPQFLLDIAESYRELGASSQALFYYSRYLAAAPDAPDREVIEDRVSELESLRAPAPAPVLVTPAPAPAAPRPRATPVWRRWWLWTAVAVALGAGITAAALASRPAPASVPASDLGDHKFY